MRAYVLCACRCVYVCACVNERGYVLVCMWVGCCACVRLCMRAGVCVRV